MGKILIRDNTDVIFFTDHVCKAQFVMSDCFLNSIFRICIYTVPSPYFVNVIRKYHTSTLKYRVSESNATKR